ncbi:MAG: hypothetical protein KDA97_04115, partial [Acidimicrobiales bacterium]|nr:hypothetical protein [Acidimicrobiales bacterium]
GDDQRVVRVAAALLRIAIGLDRSHQQAVTGLEVSDDGEVVTIGVVPVRPDADLTLELYAARERTAMAAEVLGCRIVVAAPEVATSA